MKKTLAVALLATTLTPGAWIATAQDAECPSAHVCVDYRGAVIEIDPALGFAQAFVVEEREILVRDLDGEHASNKVTFALFIANGDTYALQGEHTVARDDAYESAELLDVFTLAEAE